LAVDDFENITEDKDSIYQKNLKEKEIFVQEIKDNINYYWLLFKTEQYEKL